MNGIDGLPPACVPMAVGAVFARAALPREALAALAACGPELKAVAADGGGSIEPCALEASSGLRPASAGETAAGAAIGVGA